MISTNASCSSQPFSPTKYRSAHRAAAPRYRANGSRAVSPPEQAVHAHLLGNSLPLLQLERASHHMFQQFVHDRIRTRLLVILRYTAQPARRAAMSSMSPTPDQCIQYHALPLARRQGLWRGVQSLLSPSPHRLHPARHLATAGNVGVAPRAWARRRVRLIE